MSYENYVKALPDDVTTQLIHKLGYKLCDIKKPTIDDQTIHFWHLQLQFMEQSSYALCQYFQYYALSPVYVKNKHTNKMMSLLQYSCTGMNEHDHNCLATHLALQLSGLA